ncbi:MAG: hypothetical protein UDD43_06855 [Agathobacter sp.]|jgi:hypothetical protein|nr:hypothetical protein [Agathobacter sp.]
MKKSAELLKKLPDLVKETKENKLQWKIEFQTTEYNDPSEKPTEQIDGKDWLLDECFVSYHCEYKGKEFLLITYEQIASFEDKKKSYNLAFVPPLGNRFFDVDLLAPYAVELDQMLAYEIHMLWLTILEKLKEHSKNITIDVSPRDSAVENKQMRE